MKPSSLSLVVRATGAALLLAAPAVSLAGNTNNIMITGYWPPTNDMVRRFSTNTTQNPGGWVGGNWENRGYNIYSFFPEFPGGTAINPRGNGDFEVDYQDTSDDWWRITAEVKPVAIITFSRGGQGSNWEIESRTRNRTNWIADYLAPFQPTPSPPDPTVPAEFTRTSTLPMTEIRNAVNAANLGIFSYIDVASPDLAGGFLSEFIGYHGSWYQSIHASADDPFQCVAGGHIHVGQQTSTSAASTAVDVTLRTLITRVNALVPAPGTGVIMLGGLLAVSRRRR